MSKIEVTLAFTRHVTFHIDTTEDPVYAVTRAEAGLMYDGRTPDDEDIPDLELEKIKVGDREIEFSTDLDFSGPKDARGMSQWKHAARDSSYQKIVDGYNRAEVIRRAFATEPAEAES